MDVPEYRSLRFPSPVSSQGSSAAAASAGPSGCSRSLRFEGKPAGNSEFGCKSSLSFPSRTEQSQTPSRTRVRQGNRSRLCRNARFLKAFQGPCTREIRRRSRTSDREGHWALKGRNQRF